jgi:predicted RNA-binding protein YlxR (DUF448 family)
MGKKVFISKNIKKIEKKKKKQYFSKATTQNGGTNIPPAPFK